MQKWNAKRLRGVVCAGMLVGGLLLSPQTARAESLATEAGLGALCAVTNLVYGPVKLLYAVGGSIFAGGAWLFSAGDSAVVDPIVTASLRGDYVITPDHLRRQRSIEFIGRDPTDRELRQTAHY